MLSPISAAAAKQMLMRLQALPKCQIALLAGLLLAPSYAVLAQATPAQLTGNPPAQLRLAAAPAKAAEPVAPAITFADLIRRIQNEGHESAIAGYISQFLGVGGSRDYLDMPPVLAHAMDDISTRRVIYVTDEGSDVVFTIKTDGAEILYYANHAGVLQEAGRITTGRFGSQDYHSIPKKSAGDAFDAEKQFWMNKLSTMKVREPSNPD